MILFLTQLLQHYTYKLYELADDITAAAERRARRSAADKLVRETEALGLYATLTPEETQSLIKRHRR